MSDLLTLLDGSIPDVKSGLAGKSREDLAALRSAEADGKTRKPVLDAIDAALATLGDPGAATPPAADVDPRADATDDQNRIDFNHPELSPTEQVVQNLVAQNLAAQQGE